MPLIARASVLSIAAATRATKSVFRRPLHCLGIISTAANGRIQTISSLKNPENFEALAVRNSPFRFLKKGGRAGTQSMGAQP